MFCIEIPILLLLQFSIYCQSFSLAYTYNMVFVVVGYGVHVQVLMLFKGNQEA